MKPLIALFTKFRLSGWTVFLSGAFLLTVMLSPTRAIAAPLNSLQGPLQEAIGSTALIAVNNQTKALLHVDEAAFAKAPAAPSIGSEKARDILLNQENSADVKPPGVKSEDSNKTIATFLHLNPAVASDPESSIPVKLEALKEKLTKRGVDGSAEPQPVAKPIQPAIKPINPAAKSLDKVSDAFKGLFKDSDN